MQKLHIGLLKNLICMEILNLKHKQGIVCITGKHLKELTKGINRSIQSIWRT